MMLPHTLLLACVLWLHGESAPEAPPAIVYVYRPWEVFGFGLEPAVYCDEQKVAKMDNGRYFLLKLEPGVHAIRSTDKKDILSMEFESGKEYFVRIDLRPTYYWIGKGRPSLEPREEGLLALRGVRPLKPRDVRDQQHVAIPQEIEDAIPGEAGPL